MWFRMEICHALDRWPPAPTHNRVKCPATIVLGPTGPVGSQSHCRVLLWTTKQKDRWFWTDSFMTSKSISTSSRNLLATISRASVGQAWNQSMVQQLMREGNMRRRFLKASPIGLIAEMTINDLTQNTQCQCWMEYQNSSFRMRRKMSGCDT